MRTCSFSAQNKNGEASYIPLVAFETWYPGSVWRLTQKPKMTRTSDLRSRDSNSEPRAAFCRVLSIFLEL